VSAVIQLYSFMCLL